MKQAITQVFTKITTLLLSQLRNRQKIDLSREEIRLCRFSFSQLGEDLTIMHLLMEKNPSEGIYVDVGAYDPVTYSNTLLLYKAGFRGINIDIDKYKINRFNALRPKDYNIQAAVSDSTNTVKHLRYPLDATNRICGVDEENLNSVLGQEPIEIQEISTVKLTDLLDQYPLKNQEIYYLNVDCEGHDLNVLKSLDFSLYRPFLISVEALHDSEVASIESFLELQGYRLTGVFHVTRLYIRL